MRRRLKNTNGMTLTEVIAGMAILGIASLVLLSGFLTALAILDRGNAIHNAGQLAAGVIDGGTDTQGRMEQQMVYGPVRLQIPEAIDIYGRYLTVSDKGDTGVVHKAFSPNLKGMEDAMYDLMAAQIDLFYSMNASQRTAYGMKSWLDNINMRHVLIDHNYGGEWPVVPDYVIQAIPQDVLNSRVGDKTLYLQCYMYPLVNKSDLKSEFYDPYPLIYAHTGQDNSWSVWLIYDHEERQWYYNHRYAYSIADHATWSIVKAEIHNTARGWKPLEY